MSLKYHMQCHIRRSEAEWERKQQFSKLKAVSNEPKTQIVAESPKYSIILFGVPLLIDQSNCYTTETKALMRKQANNLILLCVLTVQL